MRTSKTKTSWYGDFPWYNIFSTFKEWASPIYEDKITRYEKDVLLFHLGKNREWQRSTAMSTTANSAQC
jgi:hypothetical protein